MTVSPELGDTCYQQPRPKNTLGLCNTNAKQLALSLCSAILRYLETLALNIFDIITLPFNCQLHDMRDWSHSIPP